jgi:hypothetical protein
VSEILIPSTDIRSPQCPQYDPLFAKHFDAMRRTIDGINARRDASLAAGRKPATLPGYRDWCFESERAVAAEGRPRRSPPQTIG